MIQFNSTTELREFIESLDSFGLIITDDQQIDARLKQVFPSSQIVTPVTGDEPAFIIKFKDELAPGAISDWITRAEMENVNQDKIAKASRQLTIVIEFQARHPDRCQLPD